MKLARTLAATLLALSAPAMAGTWQFTFTNLCSDAACMNITGKFSGEDGNADGRITRDELVSLSAAWFTAFPEWSSGPSEGPSGGVTPQFTYVIGGDLSFVADAWDYRISASLITGQAYELVGPLPEAGRYEWTPQTQTIIEALAVPEPGTAALATLGLFAVSAWVRRRGA